MSSTERNYDEDQDQVALDILQGKASFHKHQTPVLSPRKSKLMKRKTQLASPTSTRYSSQDSLQHSTFSNTTPLSVRKSDEIKSPKRRRCIKNPTTSALISRFEECNHIKSSSSHADAVIHKNLTGEEGDEYINKNNEHPEDDLRKKGNGGATNTKMRQASMFPLKSGEGSGKQRRRHIKKRPRSREKTEATDADAIQRTSEDYRVDKSGPGCSGRVSCSSRSSMSAAVGSAQKLEGAGKLEEGDGVQLSTETSILTGRRCRNGGQTSLVDWKLTKVSVLS